ncbi:hypothetical protein SDC9_79135 [bioreactor metagenome]|uniref:Uncharacterized protein n=1 Tax=bioreactor metagenome TaxID=1076179 RepID=A0A644YXK9_9ZZZZ
MRSQRNVIGLGHRGDLLDLGNAAGMTQIRLDNIYAASLKEALEIISTKQTLAGCDGDVAASGDLLEALHVFTQDGLFEEHGVKLLKLFGQDLCHGLVHAAVEIDSDSKVLAASLADSGHAFQNSVDLFVRVDHLQFFGSVHFDGAEAGVHALPGHCAGIGGTVAADPGIHADLVTALAAHQLVNRGVEKFPLNIPECLVDSG